MMNQNLEKKNHYNILYSYYQDLLTEKQKEVFENYYFEDYSLSEISLALKVSRNAIWDLLKKVERNLDNYENKLHLYQKNINLNKQLDLLKKYVNPEGLKIIEKIKEINAEIDDFNEMLKNSEAINFYLDTNSYLQNDTGFQTADEIHYTKETYKDIYNYIETELSIIKILQE